MHHSHPYILFAGICLSLSLSIGSLFVPPPKRRYGVRDVMSWSALAVAFAICEL